MQRIKREDKLIFKMIEFWSFLKNIYGLIKWILNIFDIRLLHASLIKKFLLAYNLVALSLLFKYIEIRSTLMSRNKTPNLVEGRVLQVLHEGWSLRKIVKVLKSNRINVALSTISNVERKIGLQRNSTTKIKSNRKRPSRTSSIVQRVLEKIDVEDPPTYRVIPKPLQISQSTVSKIIKESSFVLREKAKIQKLTSANVQKRRQWAHRFYRQLVNDSYRNSITTEKSCFYLDGTREKCKVCYIKRSSPDFNRMIIQEDSSRPKGFIVRRKFRRKTRKPYVLLSLEQK